MKKNDKQELFSRDIKTLRVDLLKVRGEALQLTIDNSQFKLKNTKSISTKRKEIARILTAIKEKELSKKLEVETK